MEVRHQDLFPKRKVPHAALILRFEGPNAHRAADNQEQGHQEGEFRMGRQAKTGAMDIVQEIAKNDKADAAQDDERRDRQVHDDIPPIGGKVCREKGEPGVVERRDRMKHTQIDRAQGAHVKCEPGGQDQRADGFYNQRDGHDDLHESDESFHAERAEHLHHHHALSKTDAAAERQQQKRGHEVGDHVDKRQRAARAAERDQLADRLDAQELSHVRGGQRRHHDQQDAAAQEAGHELAEGSRVVDRPQPVRLPGPLDDRPRRQLRDLARLHPHVVEVLRRRE